MSEEFEIEQQDQSETNELLEQPSEDWGDTMDEAKSPDVEDLMEQDQGQELEADTAQAETEPAEVQEVPVDEPEQVEADEIADEQPEDQLPEQDNSDEEALEQFEVDDDYTDDEAEGESEMQAEEDFEVTAESVVEAILFATDEPLAANRIAKIAETGVKQVRDHVKSLNARYKLSNNSFRIEQIAGGYQMMTLSPYNHWLRKMLRVRSDNKLSAAALETLAIIAYKQPIIRADVESVRGVAAGEMIRNLMYKGLVKIVGRAEVLGRPMLYGTTKKFLEVFGLNTLKDLPKIEELKPPEA